MAIIQVAFDIGETVYYKGNDKNELIPGKITAIHCNHDRVLIYHWAGKCIYHQFLEKDIGKRFFKGGK